MLRKIPVLLVAVAWCGTACGFTENLKEELQKLKEAMQVEVEKKMEKEESGRGDLRLVMRQFNELEKVRDFRQLEQSFSHYEQLLSSKEVSEAVASVRVKLTAEREKVAESEKNRLESLLAKCAEAFRSAKDPAELDELLVELGKSRRNDYGAHGESSEEIQRLQMSMEPARHFVGRWQEYLAAKKAGDSRAVRQALNELRQGGGREVTFMPRSELLERLRNLSPSQEDVTRLVTGIQSLDEIQEKLVALRALMDQEGSGTVAHEYINALSAIERKYREYQMGVPVPVELNSFSSHHLPDEGIVKLTQLKGELLKRVLPRYVGAPEGTEARQDETVIAFLERLEKEAKERGDGATGYRTREARRILSRGSSFGSQDINGLNAYVSGQNQEAAGQFELAVLSYQQSLKSGSDLVPAKLIGERLAGIQKNHPEAYAKGVERFLAPPAASPYGQRFDPRHPGMDQRNPKGEPAILIPPPKESNVSKKSGSEAKPEEKEGKKEE